MGLTVAVTGPTGEIGGSLIDALETSEAVGAVRGMARRPFDPGGAGWDKASYQRGDILDRGHLAELFEGADVAVHLAFAIFGDREETRRINLEGSRNVFEAAVEAGVGRLVYASSVAAYGFHPENPQPLSEEAPALGSPGFYYSAQKAELEETLDEILAGSELDAYVFRPCIVAGPRATMLVEQTVGAVRLGDPAPRLRRQVLDRLPLPAPILPDAGLSLQLVHHDDVAAALAAAVEGMGEPGAYNLAGDGEIGVADIAKALGWRSVRVPRQALGVGTALAGRLSFINPQLEWATALANPVLMDTTKARRELGWKPRFDAAETLLQTAVSARESGLLD
ncbi:MAG TPA: NAD-dependent epimerase/dehydratase family protein [Solirubrobacterales bacterium]|jgi:nucleoside-diphosphate-sugar epimerase|nr:NAD-dependent epimerase/dehydratase family protein [Solirubrobacterales bacterium]